MSCEDGDLGHRSHPHGLARPSLRTCQNSILTFSTTSKVDHFLENEAKGTNIIGARSVEELCKNLKRPRRIILLVKAGKAVDDFIAQLEPYLEKGDIIIDGGNSHYPDSIRRTKELEAKGLLFVGSGVSGGEEGARNGPSLMPGGSDAAWPHIKEIFRMSLHFSARFGMSSCIGSDRETWVTGLRAVQGIKPAGVGSKYSVIGALLYFLNPV